MTRNAMLPAASPQQPPRKRGMEVRPLSIDAVKLIVPIKHADERGFFSETFKEDVLVDHGIDARFVQDNHVASRQRGVLRGLHFQLPPHAQGKLVRCVRGAILDVAVDLRADADTFGRHVAVEISAENWWQIWVPPGFAHGYVTLEPDTEVIYKVTAPYDPQSERGIAWNDPALGVKWPFAADELLLSPKDLKNPTLEQFRAQVGRVRWG